jgi:hypothetical protein
MLTKVCTNQNCPAYAHFVFTLGMRWRAISFAGIFLLVGQSSGQSPSSENHPALNAPTAGRFVDVTEELGIHFKHTASPTSKKYLLETMGSGVALFDYDNDGRLDLFFANGARIDDPTPKGTIPQKDGPKYWNRLYHQKSDGNFEDVTKKLGSLEAATQLALPSVTMTTTASTISLSLDTATALSTTTANLSTNWQRRFGSRAILHYGAIDSSEECQPRQ